MFFIHIHKFLLARHSVAATVDTWKFCIVTVAATVDKLEFRIVTAFTFFVSFFCFKKLGYARHLKGFL